MKCPRDLFTLYMGPLSKLFANYDLLYQFMLMTFKCLTLLLALKLESLIEQCDLLELYITNRNPRSSHDKLKMIESLTLRKIGELLFELAAFYNI